MTTASLDKTVSKYIEIL